MKPGLKADVGSEGCRTDSRMIRESEKGGSPQDRQCIRETFPGELEKWHKVFEFEKMKHVHMPLIAHHAMERPHAKPNAP